MSNDNSDSIILWIRTIFSIASLICCITVIILYFINKFKNMESNSYECSKYSEDLNSNSIGRENSEEGNKTEEDNNNKNRQVIIHFFMVLLFIVVAENIIFVIFHIKKKDFENNSNLCIAQSIFYYLFYFSREFCVSYISFLFYKLTLSQSENKYKNVFKLIVGYLFIFTLPLLTALLALTTKSHEYSETLCTINIYTKKPKIANLIWNFLFMDYMICNIIFVIIIFVKLKNWFDDLLYRDNEQIIISYDSQIKNIKRNLNTLIISFSSYLVLIIVELINKIIFLCIESNLITNVSKILECIKEGLGGIYRTIVPTVILFLLKDLVLDLYDRKASEECYADNHSQTITI